MVFEVDASMKNRKSFEECSSIAGNKDDPDFFKDPSELYEAIAGAKEDRAFRCVQTTMTSWEFCAYAICYEKDNKKYKLTGKEHFNLTRAIKHGKPLNGCTRGGVGPGAKSSIVLPEGQWLETYKVFATQLQSERPVLWNNYCDEFSGFVKQMRKQGKNAKPLRAYSTKWYSKAHKKAASTFFELLLRIPLETEETKSKAVCKKELKKAVKVALQKKNQHECWRQLLLELDQAKHLKASPLFRCVLGSTVLECLYGANQKGHTCSINLLKTVAFLVKQNQNVSDTQSDILFRAREILQSARDRAGNNPNFEPPLRRLAYRQKLVEVIRRSYGFKSWLHLIEQTGKHGSVFKTDKR